jgi:hypothetical protein
VPGTHITDQQARLYMNLHRTHVRRTAAARAGFSTSTGARLDAALRMPSQTQPPRSRRRPDPLAAFWESEVLPMLRAIPGFAADHCAARVRRGTSSSGRNTRPVSKVCRTSPTLRNSACRLLTCGSSTKALCAHYGMTPARNNPGVAHENGSIEGPHAHLKLALQQALLLRGSGDVADLVRIAASSMRWSDAPTLAGAGARDRSAERGRDTCDDRRCGAATRLSVCRVHLQ